MNTWINDEMMSRSDAKLVGELKEQLKKLSKSVAESCKIALILAIYDNAGDIAAGYKTAWNLLQDEYDLRDYKGTRENPLSDAEKASKTAYNTYYQSLKRAAGLFGAYKYGNKTILATMDFSNVTRDAEFDGQLDMSICLANLDSEAKRRKVLAAKRIEQIREEEATEARKHKAA